MGISSPLVNMKSFNEHMVDLEQLHWTLFTLTIRRFEGASLSGGMGQLVFDRLCCNPISWSGIQTLATEMKQHGSNRRQDPARGDGSGSVGALRRGTEFRIWVRACQALALHSDRSERPSSRLPPLRLRGKISRHEFTRSKKAAKSLRKKGGIRDSEIAKIIGVSRQVERT